MLRSNPYKWFLVLFILVGACTPTRQIASNPPVTRLKLLSQYVIPYNLNFENTTVGGLSGIDYDPVKDLYYMISDDRSAINPARFYTTRIQIRKDQIDSVQFINVTYLKGPLGKFYPGSQKDPAHTPDPEAMRYNPKNKSLYWTSEGERIINQSKTILEDPAITQISLNGSYLDTFELPPQLKMQPGLKGPRQNGVFEGLTFDSHYKNLFVSVEEPLYPDGPRAGTGDSSALVRILKFDMHTKKPVAQYAYTIDPVAYPPILPGLFKVNGIADILWLGEDQLLVLERSYSTGRLACTLKLFIATISGADDISHLLSLTDHPGFKTISKKLLLNMDELNIYTDNIEGMTFGPILKDGRRSLIVVSDNNFNPLEKTQVLLFGIN